MKIIKAEGYKKPNYAVAIAAAMVAVTVSGCGPHHNGSVGPDLAGEATLAVPPEGHEIELAGDVSIEQIDPDPIFVCSDPNDEVRLEGATVEYIPEDEEPFVLDGGAPVYEP